MYRTRVGYAGGASLNPTYRRMGDHTETFQVDFDPGRIAYTDLLQIFWQSHQPHRKSWSRQYRAVVLYHDEAQHEQAQQSKAAVSALSGTPVETAISPLQTFYLAETYHQKYGLQNTPLMAEMKAIYPAASDWIDSTAVARLNGYMHGYGLAETFEQDKQQLGLSASGQRFLQDKIARYGASLHCPLPG